MKSVITQFEILAETESKDGLLAGCMTRLPPIVAIAGANSAGKSRLLNRVKKNLEKRQYTADILDEISKYVDEDAMDVLSQPLNHGTTHDSRPESQTLPRVATAAPAIRKFFSLSPQCWRTSTSPGDLSVAYGRVH